MNRLRRLVLYAVVACGRLIGRLLPFHNPSGLFFFFPFYHTGGAEKVHADIVNCFTDEQPWVFFTKRSCNRTFWKQFTGAARCFDCGRLLKYSYPISVGILAGLIGRHPAARVFGCNSLFYYLLLPHLPPHVRATDLLHGMGGGAEGFALPVLDLLAERVVIAEGVQDELLAFYRAEGVDRRLDGRIRVIPNRVAVPAVRPHKTADGTLQVLFVGRGSEEKRLHLIGRAARRCAEAGLDVGFTLVGDVAAWLEPGDVPYCRLTGLVVDDGQLAECYRQADLVLITSSREGFPLTLMEGMAQGCVPIATAVGGVPGHIRHLENGWLLPAADDAAVVEALLQAVRILTQDRSLLLRLSSVAFQYATEHFGSERFCAQYRQVIRG